MTLEQDALPETPPVAALDADSLGEAMTEFVSALGRDPAALTETAHALAQHALGGVERLAARLAGFPGDREAAPPGGDKRFADVAWRTNPFFETLAETYLAQAEAARALVDRVELDELTRAKVRFAVNAMLDAVAPTNFLFTNPAALRKAFDTGGQSLTRGIEQLFDDLQNNGGRPHQVDTSPFELGTNLAASRGAVVYRNELCEVLQYEPAGAQVHATPLIVIPPWINKFYILDLAPGRSLVARLREAGHTVFLVSWRNPGKEQADLALENYLTDGFLAALGVARDITGAANVNTLSLCLGGTLTGMGLAWLAAGDEPSPVTASVFLNTLMDFSEPGQLGIFTDEATIASLERRMAERGYLDGREMAATFDWMRANDLVWNYVVRNYLLGEKPPAFDILAWNADSTRMPARMHGEYLRTCYLENRLARGEASLAGRRLDLSEVRSPAFVLAAKEDHIAPWRGAYRTTRLLGGENTFLLSFSGHIAGVVNPPGNPKAHYWTGPADAAADADAWLASATRHDGSWWDELIAWLEPRGGALTDPPPLGTAVHPAQGPAPGTYVRD